ncbi:hypothetical protein [Flexivirga oryzae]|uniref:Diadenosine tetraphosphate hydrolase n=1 Tax=Flexivirga oryzae TaxID=1794944 RepID=A0A839N7H0_9MICO|nr:hypothetical protein [Flexivirga oryzae]MBB2893710.1 hypothetical protein [Flexivirga oryzae]
MTNNCWFCTDDRGTDAPPGGWFLDDGTWRAGAAPPSMAAAGTVILEARRHVVDQGGFDEHEAATFVPVVGGLLAAMRTGLGCERVYQWSTMAAFEHFHVWLLPWRTSSLHEGPAHLVDVVHHPASDAEAAEAAARVAASMGVPA